jgi:HK97 family phage major capsid protein
MSDAIVRLTEQRLAAYTVMRDLLALVDAEARSMTAEERQTLLRAEGDVNRLGTEIEDRKRADGLAAALAAPVPTPGVPSGDPTSARQGDEYRAAFGQYLRHGGNSRWDEWAQARNVPVPAEFRADMGTGGTGAAGGYLIPPGFLAKITEVLKWYGGVRQVANTITTASGQGLVWPVNDDTMNPAVIIGENTGVSETDLAFTENNLGAKFWTTGSVRISRALMQDSAFDLESVIADRFGKRFGRGQNTAFTTGTGVTGGVVACTNSSVVWSGTSNVPTYANLLAVIHSLDVAYRQLPGTCWMMSDSMLQQIQSLTDSNNRPLFVPAGSFGSLVTGVATVNGESRPGGSDSLLGYPIVVNNDLAAFAASGGGKPALFGNFNAGYIVRDVAGATAVLRLEERYADTGEVGFIGYDRCDGTIDDVKAIVYALNHA